MCYIISMSTKHFINCKYQAPVDCYQTFKSTEKAIVMVQQRFQNRGGVISACCTEYVPLEGGVGTVLFNKMKEYKTLIAQIDSETGQRDTYEAFLERCVRTAVTMRKKGITSDDIITVCSTNHLNTCVPLVAASFLGTKFANTDPSISQKDTMYLLKLVRPKMIFVSPDALKLIEDVLEEIDVSAEVVVFGESSKHSRFTDFLAASLEERDFKPYEVTSPNKTAAIVFSSGTTGFPKGVCLSHKALLAQAAYRSFSRVMTGKLSRTVLTYASAYWITMINWCVSSIASGSTRLIAPKFDHTSVWSLIDKYKVNMLTLSPWEAAVMCCYGRPEGVDTSSLLFCGSGGSPLSENQIRTLRHMLHDSVFTVGYGLTEAGGRALSYKRNDPEDLQLMLDKPTSCGRPHPGFHYKVVDPETEKILGPNQLGELRLKTETAMNGYYDMESWHVWDSEGFLKTGDIAYYDQDYCFYIVDRITDVLKYQGWQITPANLEAVLISHPATECAVVIGLPHPIDGEVPMGIVILRDVCIDEITSEELQAYADERVGDKQKFRGGVKIVQNLPLTPTGKFRRKYIRNLVIEGKL